MPNSGVPGRFFVFVFPYMPFLFTLSTAHQTHFPTTRKHMRGGCFLELNIGACDSKAHVIMNRMKFVVLQVRRIVPSGLSEVLLI